MFKSSVRQRIGHFLFCLLVLFISVCWARDQHSEVVADAKQVGWDPNKHIAIDEIKPGMEAYCLTIYQGTEVEKFGMEVLSIVRDIGQGHGRAFYTHRPCSRLQRFTCLCGGQAGRGVSFRLDFQ